MGRHTFIKSILLLGILGRTLEEGSALEEVKTAPKITHNQLLGVIKITNILHELGKENKELFNSFLEKEPWKVAYIPVSGDISWAEDGAACESMDPVLAPYHFKNISGFNVAVANSHLLSKKFNSLDKANLVLNPKQNLLHARNKKTFIEIANRFGMHVNSALEDSGLERRYRILQPMVATFGEDNTMLVFQSQKKKEEVWHNYYAFILYYHVMRPEGPCVTEWGVGT